ncbi:hypothetical protein HPB47_022189 [Ixodes persulcatus]|uniref:Uncharacterized protein n=1 Tax=Ixodes persulcatus TaxID=34615 RepID=A0AC60QB43_IXOPE|nr:hypothetical protein HPB47_022189 [Ixodes persulcatus]
MASYTANSSTSPARIFSKIRCAKISKECKQYKNSFLGEVGREVLETVSNDTGVCARTVTKCKAQCLSGKVASPKRRPCNVKISSTRTVTHDEFTQNTIRLKVHRKYSEREIPTLDSYFKINYTGHNYGQGWGIHRRKRKGTKQTTWGSRTRFVGAGDVQATIRAALVAALLPRRLDIPSGGHTILRQHACG